MAKRPMILLDCSHVRAGERVCVAVSGGADSVALLVGLAEANDASLLKEPLGIVLSAVHVHHGLRGLEADGDEAFVRELCGRMGLPLTVERVDVAGRQAVERKGVEEAARELRYGVFRALMAAGKADVVATAHTMDDQAETVMMKLLRGAWTEGLAGIAPEVEEGSGFRAQGPEDGTRGVGNSSMAAGRTAPARVANLQSLNPGPWALGAGRIVRPMLGVRRAEVEAFLRARGQGWREDATNADVSLMRNRVRRELMPMLRRFNPGVDEGLARLAEIARDEEAFWRAEVARVLPPMLLPGRPVRGGGRAVSTAMGERAAAIEVERLRGLAPALRRRVVRAAARELGCRLTAEETAKLLWLAGFGAGLPKMGARLELGQGLRAERTARELRMSVGIE